MSIMFNIKKCILLLHAFVAGIESAKILACLPACSYSHNQVFRAMTSELVKQGHQVTVITSNPMYPKDSTTLNLTEIDVHHASHKTIRKYYLPFITGKKSNVINDMQRGHDVILKISKQILELEEIRNLLKYQRDDFDLLLLEAVYLPFLGLTHIFKVPTILVSSFGAYPGIYEIFGGPTHPTLFSNVLSHRIYNLTIWDKATEIIKYLQINSIISKTEEKTNKMLKNLLGPDTPTLNDLKNNVDMLLLNVNPIWEGNYPVPPNVIHMGGIHQRPQNKLPQDLQHYLDSSSNGVVYMSFGSNVNTSILKTNTIALFTKVFTQLPYNVLWKWDNKKFPVISKNIKMFNWLPQADLLRHKNVRLFITQGGLQSTDEAITAGVPLIGIPMMADQWYNVEKYIYHKIGIGLDIDTITEKQLRNAIIRVAETESYRNNIIRLRSLMQDQPQPPLERAIWWIEYVLRHRGAKHLRAPSANMSWYEFLELELIAIVALLIFLSTFLVFVAVRFLIFHVIRKLMFNIKLKKI